jgi:chromosome segregation ATPase
MAGAAYHPAMSSDEEIERRVDALEVETSTIRDELLRMERYTAETRILAAGADREVSNVRDVLRAQQRSLQALHEDMRDLQGEVRTGFATVGAGFAALNDRLDRLAG